jgi:hypothetical protein
MRARALGSFCVALVAGALIGATFATDGRAQITPNQQYIYIIDTNDPTNDVQTIIDRRKLPPLSLGGSIGGAFNSGPSVNSSSAFYQGAEGSSGGLYVNLFANVPLTIVGPFAVRAGGMIETTRGNFDFSGTAGGVSTTSRGSLGQTDVLATLSFITPIHPRFFFEVTPVAGGGWLNESGNPGGPSFTGTEFTPVVGIDLSLLQPISPKVVVLYTVGYRHTAPTTFNTTLMNERYKVGGSNAVMASVGFTFDASDLANAGILSGFGRPGAAILAPPPTPPR